MTFLKLVATAASLAVIASSLSAASVDFDDVASGSVFAAGTDFSGLRFDQTIRVEALGSFATFTGTSGNQAFVALSKTVDFGGTFTRTVNRFQIAVGDGCCDIDRVTLTGFDALGRAVDQDSYTASSGQFLSLSGGGIKRFTIAQQGSGVIFDTISFTPETTAVPLPASLPAASLALWGLAILRRRRQI